MYYRDTWQPTNTNWKWWPGSYSWIDYPCGQGQSSPYCLNGTYYNNQGYWADNKP
jgi:hypothetical protein